MSNDTDKLGPKDLLTGCLVIVVAVFVVPILVLLFKISIYLAIAIGVMVAIVLGDSIARQGCEANCFSRQAWW